MRSSASSPTFRSTSVEPERRVYHPAAFGDLYPARIGVRVRGGDPATFSDSASPGQRGR